MCGGLDGPWIQNYLNESYKPPKRGKVTDNGGMKKECSCGQINPTNTKCWKCGKPNHYSRSSKEK